MFKCNNNSKELGMVIVIYHTNDEIGVTFLLR